MMIRDVFLDAVSDCAKELPFLFLAFLLMEALEHHAADKMSRALTKAGPAGPLVGALLGCVPQCGFSVMTSEFYAGGVVSLGTLISVYLATSDEAVVLLLSNRADAYLIVRLLVTKVILAVIFGYLVQGLARLYERHHPVRRKKIEDLCENCGCNSEENGVLRGALHHTGEVLLFLFLFTFALNLVMELIGMENLSRILLADSVFQPVLAALLGLIPNCAASVIITELYTGGVISFGSAIAGLCSSAGLGLIVLFRINRSRRDDVTVVAILYAASVISGIVLQAAGL